MEGSDQIQSPAEVLRKIKGFIRALVVDLSCNHRLFVAVDCHRTYCSNSLGNCFCSSDLPHGIEILSLEKEGHACRLSILLRVLMIIQQLLQENKHGSKRDIYYMEPSVFTDQAVVNRAINDICILLKCSRHHLNVVPVGRGLVMGWLRYVEAGRIISCITSPSTAHMIPVCVEEVEDIVSVAKYILVVEKETVFQRLSSDMFCERHHCIVITGRGYPDVPTRRFLQRLVKQLHLPAYCLVDFDPYGFDILATYRFGSNQMAYDAKLMRVSEIRWIGPFSSDIDKYQLPQRCLLSFTVEDKKKAEAMLSRCYLHQEAPQWRLALQNFTITPHSCYHYIHRLPVETDRLSDFQVRDGGCFPYNNTSGRLELEIMLRKGVKFEIEALSASSLSFLADAYIPLKILQGGHI